MSDPDECSERQPVRVLEHNVLAWFEEKYPEFRGELCDIQTRFDNTNAIKYFCDQAPILGHDGRHMTPCVRIANGQIEIHETFLSYIWALSYSILVIFDEQVHGPHTGRQPPTGKPLGYFLPKAYGLLNYALSLITDYSCWPPGSPSPESNASEDEFYVGRTNGIYLAAVDFILCHELGHVACGHLEQYEDANRRSQYITAFEQKKFEREADQWALDHVLKGIRAPERTPIAVGLGTLTGLAALLFLSPDLSSHTHPDKNERIRSVLLGLPTDGSDNLWGIAATFYIIWNRRFNVGLDFSGKYNSYAALVSVMDSQLESRKLGRASRKMWLD